LSKLILGNIEVLRIKYILICFVFTINIISSCGQLNSNLNQKPTVLVDSASIVKKNISTHLKDSLIFIIGVGDIMLGSNYPYSGSLPPDDGMYLLDSVRQILRTADVTFGNLEGTFLN